MKTSKFLTITVIISIIFLLNSCLMLHLDEGNGRVVSQDRTAKNFTGVILESVGNVTIYCGEEFNVVVTADSNVQDKITAKVSGGNLIIDSKNYLRTTKIKIDVYMPELSYVKLEGAGSIMINDGSSSDLRVILSGVGNIDALNFEAENADLTLSGAGDIKTWATRNLKCKLSGVGNIMYQGDPSLNISISGAGKIKKLNSID